jgi:hypothetical protein
VVPYPDAENLQHAQDHRPGNGVRQLGIMATIVSFVEELPHFSGAEALLSHRSRVNQNEREGSVVRLLERVFLVQIRSASVACVHEVRTCCADV